MILSPDKIVVSGFKVPFRWELLQGWKDTVTRYQAQADQSRAVNIGVPEKRYFIESVLFIRSKAAAAFDPDGNVALMNADAYEWTAPAAGSYVWKVRVSVVETVVGGSRRTITWWESNPMEFDVAAASSSPVAVVANPSKPTTPDGTQPVKDDAVKMNGEQTLPPPSSAVSGTMTAAASRLQTALVVGVAVSVLYGMAKEKGGFGV